MSPPVLPVVPPGGKFGGHDDGEPDHAQDDARGRSAVGDGYASKQNAHAHELPSLVFLRRLLDCGRCRLHWPPTMRAGPGQRRDVLPAVRTTSHRHERSSPSSGPCDRWDSQHGLSLPRWRPPRQDVARQWKNRSERAPERRSPAGGYPEPPGGIGNRGRNRGHHSHGNPGTPCSFPLSQRRPVRVSGPACPPKSFCQRRRRALG
jgi:hypothetical protein